MKKFLLILAVSTIFLGIGWAVVEQVLHVNQFGGMMNDIDPLALPDGVAADSENVITDLGNGIQPREGYISYSTEPSKALWVFAKSNGTRYLITHSGNSLKADSGNKTFAVTISTVAPSIVTAGSQLGDYFYFCNTVDGLKRWDGTTVSVASATMTMNQLVTWKGRLVGAGKPGAERTLFISRYLDGTAWTLAIDPSDDDPAQITVGGSLDENITGLYASYKDLLIWFKNTSFGGLFGSRRSNFALRTFSESIGTNHPGTVRDCDGFLRFLGPRRTVWEFNGSDLTKISEGNNELFDAIINGESNSRTETITSQSDYDNGVITNTHSESTSGSILLNRDFYNPDFETGTSTSALDWESSNATYVRKITSSITPYVTPKHGTYQMILYHANLVTALTVSLLDESDSVLYSIDYEIPFGPYTKKDIDLSPYKNKKIKVMFTLSPGYPTVYLKSSLGWFSPDSHLTFWCLRTYDFSSSNHAVLIDYINDKTTSTYTSSGTFVSATQPIGNSIASWNVFQRDETLNDGTITYGFYTDTDTTKTIGGDGLPVVGTFTSSQTITNNTIPSISTAPYAFFSAKFNITASTQNPTNDRMSITWDEGSSLKAKSVWTKQRYWLSTSRASTAYNDTIFVYDRQKQWQRYTGLNALDIQLHNSYPMIGSASGISQGETGTSDAGSSISSSYTTKYFFPNGSETRAYLRDLWMTTTNSDATLGTSIYYDGTATPITLGSFAMNGQEGYQVKKLPIPISGIQAVRHAAIRWDVTGTERWKILNGSLYFDPDTQRE